MARFLSIATGMVVLLGLLGRPGAAATTYYIAPHGSDGNSGTASGAPWGTFAKLTALQAGDTLVVMDGAYTVAANGFGSAGGGPAMAEINCSAGAHNGTPSQPITLRAQNDRQASLQGTGSTVLYFFSCTDWVVQGLYLRNVDAQVAGWAGALISAEQSNRLTFRGNLLYGPNAWFNTHGMEINTSTNVLIEDNEIYYVSRHGILLGDGVNNADGTIVRRNYFHSRDHASIPGSPGENAGGHRGRGQDAVTCYPCTNLIAENNIFENWDVGLSSPCRGGGCYNNRLYGNISLGCGSGIGAYARCEDHPNESIQMPRDYYFENNVTLRSQSGGDGIKSPKNFIVKNHTAMDAVSDSGGPAGVTAFRGDTGTSAQLADCHNLGGGEAGDGTSDAHFTNVLVANNKTWGIYIGGITSWSVDHSLIYNNRDNTPGLSEAGYANILTVNPNLGTCKVFIPVGSPAKGAGVGGADIGANIVYRYQNGALTTTPLWDPTSGRFPCGAQVAGVNDIAGASCFDVHTRLNVHTNGCTLPTAALPPPRLRVMGTTR
jgi:hypothetical protein